MSIISGGIVPSPGEVLAEEVTFTETAVAGTYTGSVTVPANSWLLDIKIFNTVYWTNNVSASMDVGDADDPNGWFAGINLKATDIVDASGGAAEVIDFNNTGGKEGAYLVTATGQRSVMYSASARVVSGIVTTAGATGTAGRTRMLVLYTATANAGAATKA